MLVRLVLACGLVLAMTLAHAADSAGTAGGGALDFTLNDIDGKPFPLAQLKGKVVLMVNVASKCGYTKQYKGLEAVYQKYKEQGLVVVGVPANEFGKQEPGTDAEIKQFCSSKFNVTFPMMSKIVVKGADIHPLYQFLTTKGPKPGDIKWNFNKFLIGRDGSVLSRHDSGAEPVALEPEIEKALAAK